jgi:peptidyl-prolyl cis-trans isomerase C
MWSRGVGLALLVGWCAPLLSGCEACSSSGPRAGPSGPSDGGVVGLSAEQAAQILARVGTRNITLGDYAAALERMDPFERMRYQTEDRRQALLEEMINVELLAREAERRGLDRQPETQELVRQFQRDELLRRLRASVPGPSQLPASEVQSYYQEHRADLHDPERRRAAQIVLRDEQQAERARAEASTADEERWRALVKQYNPEAVSPQGDKTTSRPPLDVAGDLGILSPPAAAPAVPEQATPGQAAPARAAPVAALDFEVPEPLRRAVFEIPEVGQVYPRPVAHGGRYYVLRLVSKLEARQRSLEEVDGIVRTELVKRLQAQAQTELVQRLRQSVSIRIDDAALERVPPPEPGPPETRPAEPRAAEPRKNAPARTAP